MNEVTFTQFLKRGGRSPSATARVVRLVNGFRQYLQDERGGKELDTATPDDLETYVAWIEETPKASAKTDLWAIRYYYDFAGNDDMRHLAGALRQQRIERKPFSLKDFRGADPAVVEQLGAAGIRNVKQMLAAGRTPADRQALAERADVPLDAILEFVKLSDLARIPGVKGIRARLYFDAGVDTLEKMAQWDPEALRAMLIGFVERAGFEGIAPLPAEARFTVVQAQKLPKIITGL